MAKQPVTLEAAGMASSALLETDDERAARERAEREQAERLRVFDASVDAMMTCVVPGCASPQDVHFGAVCGRVALCRRHSVVWRQVETEQAAGELLEDGTTTVRQWIETQLQARQTEGA